MRVWVCGIVALACAIGISSTAAAAKKKPFHQTAKTCAKYASPAWVQQETGIVGAAQKGPAGQCHFIVNGTRDAFQIGIWGMQSQKAALAFLKPPDDPSATVRWVSGLGTKAMIVDSPALSGAYVARKYEFIYLQWVPGPVTLTDAQEISTLRALLAEVPQ